MYAIYRKSVNLYAGSEFDWTLRTNNDVLMFDSFDDAEAFRVEAIWEDDATVVDLNGIAFTYLDSLTRCCTAFGSWTEFETALRMGYVPTVCPTTRRNRRLIVVLRSRGFRVYPN